MLHRAIIISLGLLLGISTPSQADQTGVFDTLMASLAAGLRTAASYARTGNVALAQIELDEARASLRRLRDGSDTPPPPFARDGFRLFLDAALAQSARADRALDGGDGAGAADEIRSLRRSLYELRKQAGLNELGDCIHALAPVMESLRAAATAFQDKTAAAGAVSEAGAGFRDHLARCRSLAPASTAGEAEFTRLFDGASTSAGEIGPAASAGDAGLVHRYLIELQSYANLLDFRFG